MICAMSVAELPIRIDREKTAEFCRLRGVKDQLPLNCHMRLKSLGSFVFLLAYACSCLLVIGADPDHCGICGKRLGDSIYTGTDKATHGKVFMCYDCLLHWKSQPELRQGNGVCSN
jgi:hypothetical protein